MCFEFANELREMLQAAPKPIKFVNRQDIDPPLPHVCHQSIQPFTAEPCSARFVQVFDHLRVWPASAHIGANFAKLADMTLRVSGDATVNCDALYSHFRESER